MYSQKAADGKEQKITVPTRNSAPKFVSFDKNTSPFLYFIYKNDFIWQVYIDNFMQMAYSLSNKCCIHRAKHRWIRDDPPKERTTNYII
jgi:hypothetical protein